MKRLLSLCFTGLCLSGFAQVSDSLQRLVKLEGAVNFRDIGGYKTTDGKMVKWGKMYRSADIGKLTENDLQKLKAIQLGTVVDLREDSEQKQSPDKLPEGVKYIDCSVEEMDKGMTEWMANMRGLTSGDSLFVVFMQKIDHFPQKFGPLFQSLLNEKEGESLMFHCTAGKDRTGIASALILSALGVPYQTIEADYLASNVYRVQDNERMIKMMVGMGLNEQVAKDMILVKPQYLKATFEAINAKYGTVDKFLIEALGLSKKDLKALRKKFLVEV